MTDKELLEAAAKAAGIEYDFCRPELGGCKVRKGLTSGWWSPLTDDGDALRLAVKLEMLVDFMQLRVVAGWRTPEVCIDFEEGEYCRAIVRAAAAIGLSHNAKLPGAVGIRAE